MAILQDMTRDELLAMVAKLQAQPSRKLSMKVTEKGGASLYGLGRFPVTLYKGQWERLLGEVEHIKSFLAANDKLLSVKD